MFLDNFLLYGVAAMCAQTVYYFDLYQILTQVDAWALIANNPTQIYNITSTVVTVVTNALRETSTQVFLSDSDLRDLLNYVIEQCGGGNIISANLLRELGLLNNSILAYLYHLGYEIIF